MADWVKITDLAPATSGGAAVPQDHYLNLDSVLAISYREPAPHQGQVGPLAEVYVGAQLPLRLFTEEARDRLRRALDQRAGDATTRGAYSPAGSRRAQQPSTEE